MRQDEPTERDGATEEDRSQLARDLLAEHVPLTLIADLFAPAAPPSQQLLQAEGLPDDAWWEGIAPTAAPEMGLPEPRLPAPLEDDQ